MRLCTKRESLVSPQLFRVSLVSSLAACLLAEEQEEQQPLEVERLR